MVSNPFRRRRGEEEVKIEVMQEHEPAKVIRTKSGLEIRIFGESLDIERNRSLIGITVELVNRRGGAPEEAEYKISFYKPLGEVKNVVSGAAVYIGKDGVIVRGNTSYTDQGIQIDYNPEP